jgi:hypothetical protein
VLNDLMTELIGWLMFGMFCALILPGVAVTIVLDRITPLYRGQLWALSVLFSGIAFVALGFVLAWMDRLSDILVWYLALVIFLAIVAGVLAFGFKATWVGAFLSKLLFGSELFNIDLRMPTVIQISITSVIALTGTVAVLLGRSVLGRMQVWMLALLLNGLAVYGLARWGLREYQGAIMLWIQRSPRRSFSTFASRSDARRSFSRRNRRSTSAISAGSAPHSCFIAAACKISCSAIFES